MWMTRSWFLIGSPVIVRKRRVSHLGRLYTPGESDRLSKRRETLALERTVYAIPGICAYLDW